MWGNWPEGRKTNLVQHVMDQKPEYLLGRTIFSISKHRWKVGPWNLYLLNPFQTQFCDSLGRATLASRPQILLHEFRDPNTHPISYHSGLSERFTQFLQCFSLPVSLWMVKKNVHSGPLASFQKNTPALLLTLQTPGNQIPPRRPHQTLPPWWLSAETQRMERQSSKSLDPFMLQMRKHSQNGEATGSRLYSNLGQSWLPEWDFFLHLSIFSLVSPSSKGMSEPGSGITQKEWHP